MKTTSKKLFSLLGSAFLLGSTALQANDYDYDDASDKKNVHAVPAAQYPVGDNLTFFIDAAYTLWVPYQEGMNLFILGGHLGVQKGNIYRPKMSACSGFKVGMGVNTQHDGWRSHLGYTWFYHNPSTRAASLKTGNDIISPDAYLNLWDDVGTQNVRYGESKFKTQFNRIDLTLDRSFFSGTNIAFRPWIGLMAAWDYQKLEFASGSSALSRTVESANDTADFDLKQEWWGIGQYSGLETKYYFTKEFGLYLSMGGALLLTDRTNTHTETTYDTTQVTQWYGDNNFTSVEPMLENAIGVCYNGEWPDWGLDIFAEWDCQTYFFHNGFLPQVPNADDVSIYTNRGNFSLQGLTIGLILSF